MNGRENEPASWALRYRRQRSGGQSYSHACARCGRFIHREIISASVSGSAGRAPYGAAICGIVGAGTARTSSEIVVNSRGRMGSASSVSII